MSTYKVRKRESRNGENRKMGKIGTTESRCQGEIKRGKETYEL